MGRYKIEITGIGDHRSKKFLEAAKAFVKQCDGVDHAVLSHWPDTNNTVHDDLLNGHRVGRFTD